MEKARENRHGHADSSYDHFRLPEWGPCGVRWFISEIETRTRVRGAGRPDRGRRTGPVRRDAHTSVKLHITQGPGGGGVGQSS